MADQSLEQMTAYDVSASFNLTGRGMPARVPAARVTASFFPTLGVNPQLGRVFTPDEDQPNGRNAVILTHAFWQQYFGSDPRVLGQVITLDATPHTVVGVMPSSFRFSGGSEVQILVASERQSLTRIVGRLKPDVSVPRVQAELSAIEKRADPNIEVKVVPLAEHVSGNLRPAIVTLMAVVGLVLLIACANVANLTLARASARTREIAVRAALGAGRARLARQSLVESLTLAIAGGVAGLLFAAWGVNVMTRLIPASIGADILSLTRPRVDSYVLLFSLVISVATGILFGLAPAIAGTRMNLAERLKDGVPATHAGPRGGLLRGVLVVTEISLALVLLIGAGLLIKSFYRVLSIDPEFAPERVLTMRFSLADSRYGTDKKRSAFFSAVLRHVESLPGVRSAALSDSLPLSPYSVRILTPREFDTHGGPPPSPDSSVFMYRMAVSPSYFYTLGIPVLRGRTFTDRDNEQSPEVAIVNEMLARVMWPGDDAVGKELPVAAPIPISRFLGEPWNRAKYHGKWAGATFNHQFTSDWNIRNGFRATFFNWDFDDVFPNFPLADNRTLARGFEDASYPRRFFDNQTDVIGTFSTGPLRHTLLFGFEAGTQKIRQHALGAFTAAFFGLTYWEEQNQIAHFHEHSPHFAGGEALPMVSGQRMENCRRARRSHELVECLWTTRCWSAGLLAGRCLCSLA